MEVEPEEATEVKWFYSGRGNGWWQYDDRTSKDIEEAFQDPEKKQVEISIVGFIYTIDFEKEIQFRNSDPSRHRKVKRETSQNALLVKGIAGLRLHEQKPDEHGESSHENLNRTENTEIAGEVSTSPTQDSSPASTDQSPDVVTNLQAPPEPSQDF